MRYYYFLIITKQSLEYCILLQSGRQINVYTLHSCYIISFQPFMLSPWQHRRAFRLLMVVSGFTISQ